MARKPARKPSLKPGKGGKSSKFKTAQRSGKNSLRNAGIGIAVFFGVLLFVAEGLAVFLVMGLAPSMVSLFAERAKDRANRVQTIAAFNIAGVLPFAVEIVRAGSSLDAASAVLGNASAWLVIFGAAGTGFLLLAIAPQITAAILQTVKSDRLKRVDKKRREMIAEWGHAIAGSGGKSR